MTYMVRCDFPGCATIEDLEKAKPFWLFATTFNARFSEQLLGWQYQYCIVHRKEITGIKKEEDKTLS